MTPDKDLNSNLSNLVSLQIAITFSDAFLLFYPLDWLCGDGGDGEPEIMISTTKLANVTNLTSPITTQQLVLLSDRGCYVSMHTRLCQFQEN